MRITEQRATKNNAAAKEKLTTIYDEDSFVVCSKYHQLTEAMTRTDKFNNVENVSLGAQQNTSATLSYSYHMPVSNYGIF